MKAGTKSAHRRTSLSRSCDMKNADCRAILSSHSAPSGLAAMNFEVPEFRRGTTSSRAADREDSHTERKPPRDIKRSILIFGLGALSWVATYVGMLELIEANMGDLPLVHRSSSAFPSPC